MLIASPREVSLVSSCLHDLLSRIPHAIRDDVARVGSLINQLDRPTSQVLIEAHIVETTRETAKQLGVQWGGLYHNTSGGNNYWITPGANAGGTLGQTSGSNINPTSGMASNFPAALENATGQTSPTGFALGYVAESVNDYVLNVQLAALESESKLNILSTPSITTLDNQAAIVESGAEVPFRTFDENGKPQIEFKKAVLRLKVTPHVGYIQDKDREFYDQFHIIIAGLDNVEARRWLNSLVHSFVEFVDEKPDPATVKPLIDGGTEAFNGQARVIRPYSTSCYECSLDMLNQQTKYQFCTIAQTPRIPEHCIAFAYLLKWPEVFPDKKIDTDSAEDIQWIFKEAQKKAEEHSI